MSRINFPDQAPVLAGGASGRTSRTQLAAAVLLFSLLTGCGPIASTGPMLRARDLVVEARAAGSERFAMYEFAMAREYLAKAREEWSYSDFKRSREYSDLAADFAKRAIARAKRDSVSTPSPEPVRVQP